LQILKKEYEKRTAKKMRFVERLKKIWNITIQSKSLESLINLKNQTSRSDKDFERVSKNSLEEI
jgi:uncharacterized protein YpuA (DUF1002 family)